MGRSKKNWDHLVDHSGNYGIDVKNGLYPAIKGTLKGQTGQKGEPGLGGNKGNQGTPGLNGQAGKKGERGDSVTGPQGDPLVFDDLTQAQRDAIKGQKGADGQEGGKGDEAVAPVLFFKGQVDNMQGLPAGAGVGDTYYVTLDSAYFAWDGSKWVGVGNAIKGQKGIVGEKGPSGSTGSGGGTGQKGEAGKDGTDGIKGDRGVEGKSAYDTAVEDGFVGTESEFIQSLKGEPGVDANGNSIDLNDYYTKVETDDIIQFFDTPESAFNYFKHSTQNHVLTGNISFAATDRSKPIYDEGCAQIDSNATIDVDRRPPFKNMDRMLLVNYAIFDPNGSRSSQYSVIQVVYTDDEQEEYKSFIRRAQPAQGQFTDWHVNSFDPNLYYTKKELVALINNIADTTYEVRADIGPKGEDSTATLTLHEKNGSGLSDSSVIFQGLNGIDVRRESGRIILDTSSIAGMNYVGPIQAGNDPYDRVPNPNKGDFLLYASSGVAWNGENVTTGDMVIFTPNNPLEPWGHIFIGGETGVVSVSTTGILELEGDAANPVIGLPADKVVSPEELQEILVDYAKWREVISVLRGRRIGSLSDVESGSAILGSGGSYGTQVDSLPAPPLTKGTYFPDVSNNTLYFAQNDVIGRNVEQFYNQILPDLTEIRIVSVEGDFDLISKVLEKSFDGKNYGLVFPEQYILRNIDASDAGFNLNILENYDTPDNSVLVYDEATRKWYPEPKESGFLEVEADAKYLPLKGPATFQGKLIVSGGQGDETSGEIDLTGSLKVVGDVEVAGTTRARRGFLSASDSPTDAWKTDQPHGVVTLAKLREFTDEALLPENASFLPLIGGELTGPLTLSQTLGLVVPSGDAVISASGSSDAALVFKVQEGESQLKTVFSLDPGVANFQGLRVAGVGTARDFNDALSFGQAKTYFMPINIEGGETPDGPGSSDGDISIVGSGKLTVKKDAFIVEIDEVNRLRATSSGVEFDKAFSKSITGSYAANELTTYQTVVDLIDTVKFEDAAFDSKSYARKNGEWSRIKYSDIEGTPPAGEGGEGGIEDVPATPIGDLYLRKAQGSQLGGTWIKYETATAEIVDSLPVKPVRGTIYLTSSNVVAIGI